MSTDWTVDYKEGQWELAVNYTANIMPTTKNIAAAHRAVLEANQNALTLGDYARVAEMVRKWDSRYRRNRP
jgi:hypothetical protein